MSDGGHGVDGGVLETDLECVGRGARAPAGQRAAHEGGTGAQNGHEGRGVDRGAGATWLATREFFATAPAAGTARGDALSHQVGGRARAAGQSRPEGTAGERWLTVVGR